MYFELVRHFGKTYQIGGNNTQLAVPLRLAGITDYAADLSLARSRIEEVYSQIISDLNDAYAKLPAENDIFTDKYAAKALLAKVYFQQGNYVGARDVANDVLVNNGHSLASVFSSAFNNDADGVEDIFTFQVISQGGDNNLITFYASQLNGGRQADIDLQVAYFDLFDDAVNNVRDDFIYLSPDNGGTLTPKYTNKFANVAVFRIADMYLVRAESNFRESTTKGLAPLDEINALIVKFLASPLTAVTLDLFFNERQLELAFEGHLIYDLKKNSTSCWCFIL